MKARRGLETARDPWFEIADDLLCEVGNDGYFKRLSPSWERCLGYSRDELMSRPYVEFLHPDDRAITEARTQDIVLGDPAFRDFENRYVHKDGSWRRLRWRRQAIHGGRVYAIACDVTEARGAEEERRAAGERLRRSEALQRVLTTNLPDVTMFLLDRDLRFLVCEGSSLRYVSWMPGDLFRGRLLGDLPEMPSGLQAPLLRLCTGALDGEPGTFSFESDTSTHAVQIIPTRGDDGGEVESVLVVVRDTTRQTSVEWLLAERAHDQAALTRKQAAVARLGQRALVERSVDAVLDEVAVTVAETLGVEYCAIVEFDHARATMDTIAVVGTPPSHQLRGLPLVPGSAAHHLLTTREPLVVEDYESEQRFPRSAAMTAGGVRANLAVLIEGREGPFGALVAHSTQPRPFSDDDVNFMTAVANLLASAVDRHRDDAASRHAALHDPLTGLPNRTLALDRLEVALARRRREGTTVAALMLDLDRFKVINDSLGHAVGDELLIAVAARLRDTVRPQDTVARLSGDEFVVVCESPPSVGEIVTLAQRLSDAVGEALQLTSGEHFVSTSIGIAIAESGSDTSASLLRDADAAMYRAKSRGPGRHELFDDAMRSSVTERLDVETGLRGALARDELLVYYQPIIDADGEPMGCEALVRWQHPQRGLVAPLDFIPIAEETGLIADVGRWVLEQACAQGAAWQHSTGRPLTMWVNVSGRQLANPHFPAEAAEIARHSGLLPGTLGLEVTESVLMEEADSPVAVLNLMHDNGLRLVLDDFGTGYSSLSYLKHFPLDAVKIDRTFTAGLAANPMDVAIVRAIIDMSDAGGMTVVAEGVETEDQRAQLRELGCHHLQGFLFSRPVPAAELEPLLGVPVAARR